MQHVTRVWTVLSSRHLFSRSLLVPAFEKPTCQFSMMSCIDIPPNPPSPPTFFPSSNNFSLQDRSLLTCAPRAHLQHAHSIRILMASSHVESGCAVTGVHATKVCVVYTLCSLMSQLCMPFPGAESRPLCFLAWIWRSESQPRDAHFLTSFPPHLLLLLQHLPLQDGPVLASNADGVALVGGPAHVHHKGAVAAVGAGGGVSHHHRVVE